jgi:uncharacterized protein YcbX
MRDSNAATAGALARLRRYPVKSMLGEDLNDSLVTERGLQQDRGFALVHRETGRVASAKNPRLWRGLLQMSATVEQDGGVCITLPDGKLVRSSDADADEVLSGSTGQPVMLTDTPPSDATLERSRPDEVLGHDIDAEVGFDLGRVGAAAPAGTFFDFAPVHLVTTSTLARVAELSPSGAVDWRRYRPNLVLDTPADGFAEQQWIDRELHIGPDLVLRVIASTPRCAVPTLAHGDLPRDLDALRVPARHNRARPFPDMSPEPCVGVYAKVLRPGRVSVTDSVRLH